MNIEQRLRELVTSEVKQAGGPPIDKLTGETVLLNIGLDSLGFASIIVAMEQEFGLDPFGGSDDIVYPETFGELIELYRAQAEHCDNA